MFKPAKPDYTENSVQKCHEILYIPFTKNSIAYSSAFVNVFYEIFAQKIKKKKKPPINIVKTNNQNWKLAWKGNSGSWKKA